MKQELFRKPIPNGSSVKYSDGSIGECVANSDTYSICSHFNDEINRVELVLYQPAEFKCFVEVIEGDKVYLKETNLQITLYCDKNSRKPCKVCSEELLPKLNI